MEILTWNENNNDRWHNWLQWNSTL
jgi:hypothetical protein